MPTQPQKKAPKPTIQEFAMEDGHASNTTDEFKVGQVILVQNPGQVVDLQRVVVPAVDGTKSR